MLVFSALAAACGAKAGDEPGFLHAGDRWVMTGDSITHNDLYRRKVERVFKHFHPDTPVIFTQVGVSGVTSSHRWADEVSKEATVISIMLGMNNYINSALAYGEDQDAFLNAYRSDIEAQLKDFRGKGAEVLLFSPTYTDPRFDYRVYELRGGEEFLRRCAGILKEIAAKTPGVYYVPVQEEFEAFAETTGRKQILRPDGVHPSAPGQYQIARTLWEHLNFAAPIGEKNRLLAEAPLDRVPAKVSLKQRILATPGEGVKLELTASQPLKVVATWSAGDARGQETLELSEKETCWRIPVPNAVLAMTPGQMRDIVVDLFADGRRSIYLIDLACVPVLHPKEGVITGEIMSQKERPEGRLVGTWAARFEGKGLLLSGEVFDKEISSNDLWPWARDGVAVWLDLRPSERFGDIGIDEDVHMTLLNVMEGPFFGCTLIPWLGRGMSLAADSGATRTPTGYKWNLFVHRSFSNKSPVDVSQCDFTGFNLVIADEDTAASGKAGSEFSAVFRPEDEAIDKHPDSLLMLDWNHKISGEQAIHLNLFGR